MALTDALSDHFHIDSGNVTEPSSVPLVVSRVEQ